jgi:glycosyltransferase involved in cell wall biosynthesis
MKIGIDAKWFFSGPPSTRTVLQNILPHLLTNGHAHEWYIFLDQKDKAKGPPISAGNLKIIYVWAGINLLSNLFVLPKHVKKLGLDVMLFQSNPARLRNSYSIAFVHDIIFKTHPAFFSRKERLYFSPFGKLLKNANRLVVTSEYVKNEIVRYGFKSSTDIDVVPLAVSKNYKPAEYHDPAFVQRVKIKWQLPDKFLLYTGRINVRKNISILLECLPGLKDQNIPLVIVGEIEGKSIDLEKAITKLKLDDRVRVLGHLPTDELNVVFALATLFCFPSYAEGFGLPPLEAMASGVPVIISNRTALPEVCSTAASYVDPDDKGKLIQLIDTLLNDPVIYGKKRSEGLAHAAKFDWEKTSKQLMDTICSQEIIYR